MKITTIGLDLAKSVFQVHGVDAEGRAVSCKRLRRGQLLDFFKALEPCLVGMEACGGAHHWAREIMALGHEVKLMPPQYVRPYVKRNKTDAADAEAICEAVRRPNMHFVPVKTLEQQSILMLHRGRELLLRQRTMLINALRGHLAELGLVARQGRGGVDDLVQTMAEADEMPSLARRVLDHLAEELREIETRLKEMEKELLAWHKASEASQRLATIPGIGPITATALAATAGDGRAFKSGRQFAAWLGLVPGQHSSGGKPRLGGISKKGDGYLRRLLVHGARTQTRWRDRASPWFQELLGRRPVNVAVTALANKNARIAWALLNRDETFRRTPPNRETAQPIAA